MNTKVYKIFILLFIFTALFSFKNYALSAVIVAEGSAGDGTQLIWNSPPPSASYAPGDEVNFSGAIRVASCANGLYFNKITFYIAEDRDIPIKSDPSFCQNCGGATSGHVTCSPFNLCDKVQILDTTSGYKIYKLGEIYPPDVVGSDYWGNPAEIQYNETFTIPQDIDIEPPYRFYIQYSGTHWTEHWHWLIAYEKSTSYDLALSTFDVRTFICKNKDFDLSYLKEYLSKNPNYQFAPSTTYASQFYNEVASSTCPESQRNRPVEFYAVATCEKGACPKAKIRIEIKSISPRNDQERKVFESPQSSKPPVSLKVEHIFNKAYDYLAQACVIPDVRRRIRDLNPSNDCQEQTIRIFDYMCLLGFCNQLQRDINNPSPILKNLKYRIIKTFGTTNSPCLFWRNQNCKAKYGF
jgi:hypothetical protein